MDVSSRRPRILPAGRMSRDQGFRHADLDVTILDDPKVRALVRSANDEAIAARCLVGYLALITSSWSRGERVSLEDAAPLWLTDLDELRGHLAAAALIDDAARIPDHAWSSWFIPAADRLERNRDRWRKAAKGRRSTGDTSSTRGVRADSTRSHGLLPSLPSLPSVLPTSPSQRATAKGFTAEEWEPFLAAWFERGFRYPPSGREDQPKTQRAVLWSIVSAFPTKAPAWCRAAPAGADPFHVVQYIAAQWRRETEGSAA